VLGGGEDGRFDGLGVEVAGEVEGVDHVGAEGGDAGGAYAGAGCGQRRGDPVQQAGRVGGTQLKDHGVGGVVAPDHAGRGRGGAGEGAGGVGAGGRAGGAAVAGAGGGRPGGVPASRGGRGAGAVGGGARTAGAGRAPVVRRARTASTRRAIRPAFQSDQ